MKNIYFLVSFLISISGISQVFEPELVSKVVPHIPVVHDTLTVIKYRNSAPYYYVANNDSNIVKVGDLSVPKFFQEGPEFQNTMSVFNYFRNVNSNVDGCFFRINTLKVSTSLGLNFGLSDWKTINVQVSLINPVIVCNYRIEVISHKVVIDIKQKGLACRFESKYYDLDYIKDFPNNRDFNYEYTMLGHFNGFKSVYSTTKVIIVKVVPND